MPLLAYYSEAGQASGEASPSQVHPRGLIFLVFFVFEKFVSEAKRLYFQNRLKNPKVAYPPYFFDISLSFCQNGKKRQNIQSFFGEYFIVIIHRFSPNFQGMLPQSGYNLCPLLGLKVLTTS